ncbi:MAG TPA: Wzy polymerase domain-containing protein [Buttiauxella sp.]|jgi:O-antigen polymerase
MIILTLVFIMSFAFYLPGSGGQGIALPFNLIFLCWAGIFLLLMAIKNINNGFKQESNLFIVIGTVCLILPWLFYIQISPGVIMLVIALWFWLELRKIHFTAKLKRQILQIVFYAALVQCALCLVQTFLPAVALRYYEYDWLRNHGRPFGIFQQANLLASFVATGFACGFFLLFLDNRRGFCALYHSGLWVMSFVLVINQSRTGELGAFLTLTLLSLLFAKTAVKRCFSGWIITLAGGACGIWILQHMFASVDSHTHIHGYVQAITRDYADSSSARWSIIKVTWHMVMEKPWLGWGYGAFEAQFANYLLLHPELNFSHAGAIPHPHSELLYAWFQGGVTALAGMLILATGWLLILRNALRRDAADCGYALLLIPLLIHLNLEYPFYQSFIHLGLFVLLLRLSVTEHKPTKNEWSSWKDNFASRILNGAFGLVLIALSCISLVANAQLTQLERQHLANFPLIMPWYFYAQPDRANFDSMVALLLSYNRDHDSEHLRAFLNKGSYWLQTHADKNVMGNMVSIETYFGMNDEAAVWRKRFEAMH